MLVASPARPHARKRSPEQHVVINEDFFGRYLGPILRYMASAERGWHRAITQLRTVQNDRRKNEQVALPQPQPIEAEKVMAIGSVSQNDPEPERLQPVAGASHPMVPHTL
jgi:hypothetical protein